MVGIKTESFYHKHVKTFLHYEEGSTMKKAILLAFIGSLILSAICYAEGNVSVSEKAVIIPPGDDSGNFYAKIQNDGDAPVGVNSGKLVLFSGNDEILVTSDYVTTYPSRIVLQPGEYTYIKEFLWDSALKNQTIGDIKFSVDSTDSGTDAERVPCDATFEINGSDSFDNYIHITVTNEADQTRNGYYLVGALIDTTGNLVYVDTNQYENVGLHAGSTATFSMYIDNDSINYFESNGIQIGSVDAIVYYRSE